jgi:hypothetical protein
VPELAIAAARAAPEEGEIVLSPAAVAVQAAEAVLAEPILAEAYAAPPPAGEPDAAPAEWCFSVTVNDLALELEMRHPRMILALLEFVHAYNQLAPLNEDIHMPKMPQSIRDKILNHASVVCPAPEFINEVARLRFLLDEIPVVEEEEVFGVGAEGVSAPPPAGAEEDWYVGITCSDLALSLDMRHPLVVLQFLRFVDTYNELAPYGRKINVPFMTYEDEQYLMDHDFFHNLQPEYQEDVNELYQRVGRHRCLCRDCQIAEHGYDSDSTRGYDSD